MTDGQLLKAKINDSGLKFNFIAQELGITVYGLYKKVNNQTEFKASEISKIKQILNLDQNEVEAIFFANSVE